MDSLAQFLTAKGLDKTSNPDDIEKAKAEFKKLYFKEKQKEFRETHIRKEIYLTKKEFGYLIHHAEKHQQKLSRFIKNAAFAYLQNKYILPDDTQVRNLELEIRRAGNLWNQIAKRANTSGVVTKEDIRLIKVQLEVLSEKASKALRDPSKHGGNNE